MTEKFDLQQDWPADPQNEDLAQFAAQIRAVVPALAPESLARVQRKLDDELMRGERRQRRGRIILGWSIAASILIALVGYAGWRSGGRDAALDVGPRFVQDRINIAYSEPAISDAGRALVPLDDYRSLFTE